jgi:hypothetical protein
MPVNLFDIALAMVLSGDASEKSLDEKIASAVSEYLKENPPAEAEVEIATVEETKKYLSL